MIALEQRLSSRLYALQGGMAGRMFQFSFDLIIGDNLVKPNWPFRESMGNEKLSQDSVI